MLIVNYFTFVVVGQMKHRVQTVKKEKNLADEKQKIVFNFIQEESHKHSDTKRFVFGDLALNSLKLYMKK